MPKRTKKDSDLRIAEQAEFLLEGLRALTRTQQISERANVACGGMTVAQAATLQVLYLEGPMRLGVLSRRLGIAPSTLTRNVERIEARGWVERVSDPKDGRAYRMRLTADGRTQARQIEEQNEQFAQLLIAELPLHRRERVIGGLLDLLEAIDRLAGELSDDQFKPIHEFLEARKPSDRKERS
ncbi:MAG: winged helix-turn-helix transcriptional regulator [bacterium]|nr:winged helix-turn-helix transcriptional regulator [bacterium]